MVKGQSRNTHKVLSKTAFILLEALAAFGDGAKAAMSVPYKRSYTKSQASYYRGLRELSRNNLIQKRRLNNKNTYVLTDAGRKLLRKPKYTSRRNDGFSTVIIFDIPEEKSRQRTIFRRYLTRNGYSSLQKSVYIGPFSWNAEIELLIKELKLNSYITTLDAKVTYKL